MLLQLLILAKDNKNSRVSTAYVRADSLSLDVIQVYRDKAKSVNENVSLFRGI